MHNGGVLTVGSNGQSTLFGGVIANSNGAGGLTKTGAGLLTLTGANTYSGLTTVSAGSIVVDNAAALGSTAGGTVVGAGASLDIEGGVTVGAEALTLNGAGVGNLGALQNLTGVDTYNGAITLASNSRILAASGRLTVKSVTGAGKTLAIGGPGTSSSIVFCWDRALS